MGKACVRLSSFWTHHPFVQSAVGILPTYFFYHRLSHAHRLLFLGISLLPLMQYMEIPVVVIRPIFVFHLFLPGLSCFISCDYKLILFSVTMFVVGFLTSFIEGVSESDLTFALFIILWNAMANPMLGVTWTIIVISLGLIGWFLEIERDIEPLKPAVTFHERVQIIIGSILVAQLMIVCLHNSDMKAKQESIIEDYGNMEDSINSGEDCEDLSDPTSVHFGYIY